MGTISPSDIEALIDTFNRSDYDELRLEIDGMRIYLSKNAADRGKVVADIARFEAPPRREPAPEAAALKAPATPSSPAPAPNTADSAASPRGREAKVPDGLVAIRAPNLGTFYRQPKPGAPAYVEVGQTVGPDTDLCLIEVMKLFTTVRAGMKGIVREICVQDGELVEGDQLLFLIEPTA